MQAPHSVLFLCTGNYYRSRFAEEWFNHLAAERDLPWRADSAGLRVPQTRQQNPGKLSVHALNELKARKVKIDGLGLREPRQVTPAELESTARCIALSESEHRPMLEADYPKALGNIEFWTVEDLHLETIESALGRIADKVEVLVKELA